MKISTKGIAVSGVIGAIYAALTIALAPICYGPFQFRASEALCILPVFTPYAIPGLFAGCFIANIPNGLLDCLFGSLTTLIASIITYKWRQHIWLAVWPPIVLNGLIVGFYLSDAGFYHYMPLWASIGSVTVGEMSVLLLLGIPLYYLLKPKSSKLF